MDGTTAELPSRVAVSSALVGAAPTSEMRVGGLVVENVGGLVAAMLRYGHEVAPRSAPVQASRMSSRAGVEAEALRSCASVGLA